MNDSSTLKNEPNLLHLLIKKAENFFNFFDFFEFFLLSLIICIHSKWNMRRRSQSTNLMICLPMHQIVLISIVFYRS